MREKLIKLLNEAEEWADHKCDESECKTCQADKMKSNCVQQLMVDRLIANGVTIDKDNNVPSKWIPVTERLPDKHGKPYVCLLTFPHGGQFPYILNWYEYGDNGYVNGRHFQDEGLDGMKVTHWMPLPEPPKGE